MNKRGYTVVELVIVLAVFTVAYFTAAVIASGKISFNFEEELYKEKISAIEKQASIYAMSDESLFASDEIIYVTVGDLAEKNAVIANEDGEVVDPRNNENNLNNVKVKLVKQSDKVTAKVLN